MPSIIQATSYGIRTQKLTTGAAPTPPADRLMQGVYGKVEYNQSVTNKTTWFPDPYVPASHATSIFGYLDNKAWLKGILEEVNFGEFDDGAGGVE